MSSHSSSLPPADSPHAAVEPDHQRPARPAPRGTVAAWALWDAGSASFNAIMTTFVFSVYLTSSAFGDAAYASSVMSSGLTIAGVCIALLAPVTGQRADTSGNRTLWLIINTLLTSILMALCFFAAPSPDWLLYGVTLLCVANVVNEFASVNYNAILPTISTPATVGRIGGIGWASGYFGGIVALLIVLFGFIGMGGTPGFLGIPHEDSLHVRAVAIFSGLWFAGLTIPLFISLTRRDRQAKTTSGATAPAPKLSFIGSYKELGKTIARLYRNAPQTLYFLIASAVFRDGLVGIFTFGGILATGTFGFSTTDVILFAIAGNVVAGVGALIGGRLDDRLGPKRVIMLSLIGILLVGIPLLFSQTPLTFWICGLALCSFVGPAQSASRTYLSRLTPAGQEGEIFGLYSTTGRATSFLAPALFTLFVSLLGAQIWGVLGILTVITLGLLLLIPLNPAPTHTPVSE